MDNGWHTQDHKWTYAVIISFNGVDMGIFQKFWKKITSELLDDIAVCRTFPATPVNKM